MKTEVITSIEVEVCPSCDERFTKFGGYSLCEKCGYKEDTEQSHKKNGSFDFRTTGQY